MNVMLTYSPAPREVWTELVALPDQTTLAELTQHPVCLGWAAQCVHFHHWVSDPEHADTQVSVWTHKRPLSTGLKDGDRVEWSRPLKVDPKEARRERFQAQGARTAGLFSKKRQGAKAGY